MKPFHVIFSCHQHHYHFSLSLVNWMINRKAQVKLICHSPHWCQTTAERGASWGQQSAAFCTQRSGSWREYRPVKYCQSNGFLNLLCRKYIFECVLWFLKSFRFTWEQATVGWLHPQPFYSRLCQRVYLPFIQQSLKLNKSFSWIIHQGQIWESWDLGLIDIGRAFNKFAMKHDFIRATRYYLRFWNLSCCS